MRRREITDKLERIIDFAGVRDFIDTPVKRYSSGMYVRLAFAVAAHLEPEILVVDEVLAVGDAAFQKKCLGKMEEISMDEGRTVVLVSHDLDVISNLTSSAFLLQQGKLVEQGETKKVIKSYIENLLQNPVLTAVDKTQPHFSHFQIVTSLGGQLQSFGEALKIELGINLPAPVDVLEFSFQIIEEATSEPIVYNWFSTAKELRYLSGKKGEQKLTINIPQLRLYKGNYYFRFYLSDPRGKIVFQTIDAVLPFQIQMNGITNEWGWQNNVCKYIENCTVKIETNGSIS